ncbi:MAG: SsrA-binding protein SmpB, partial [bacterium]|nr:SsrA-binding protein SmpB [bacterium]
MSKESFKIAVSNRKAGFLYHLLEKFEAGLVLTGSEVKSLRDGKGNLVDSYVIFKGGEIFLLKAHISPYPAANRMNHEPTRSRKLLLHAKEIERLIGKMKEKGLTLIPTKIYFKGGRAKVEIALAQGKKLHDKRESLKKKVHQ